MTKMTFDLFEIPNHKPGAAQSFLTHHFEQTHSLAQWWSGKYEQLANSKLEVSLKSLHDRCMWLSCSCARDSSNPPLMTVVALDASYTVRRMPKRGVHIEGCVFWSEQIENSGQTGSDPFSDITAPLTQPSFLKLQKQASLVRKSDSQPRQDSKNGSVAVDSLQKELFWLLSTAGVNTYPQLNPSAEALIDFSSSVQLAKGVSLSQLLFCGPDAFVNGKMESAFNSCRKVGAEQVAYLVCPVTSASRLNSTVRLIGSSVDTHVEGKLGVYGDDATPSRYPMLMYGKVIKNAAGDVSLQRAYLHPVCSELEWVPVDSNNERTALDVILDACRVLSGQGRHIRVEKPLFEWNRTGSRPDFVLTRVSDYKTLIIETMGFADDEYLDRKKRMTVKLQGYKIFRDERLTQTKAGDDWLHGFIMDYFFLLN